ncbi:hypothetical protein DKX38_023054 [Salix brachista]|uniref:U6 snRNA-associated Sm-like protein LSm4 n=1 Tax=Salix brachista TaxID=2182728 RepID=A0A5N5K6U4_9ROSI|nr:hypothetical protein DKX38_023054 [Salix brachista]
MERLIMGIWSIVILGNIHLREVICTSKDGDRFWRMPKCYIRGNTIKYLRVPDEVGTYHLVGLSRENRSTTCCQQEIQSLTQLPSTMEINDGEEEEFEFSRNYFLAKELAGSGKKSTRKISDIKVVDEQFCFLTLQELRAASANIEPKHEKEINLDCMS